MLIDSSKILPKPSKNLATNKKHLRGEVFKYLIILLLRPRSVKTSRGTAGLALPSHIKKPAKDAGFVVAPSGLEPELS